jgi:hypothetical protein
VESLLDGGLGVEGEAGVDLGRDLARDNLKDLLAELNEKTVEGVVDLRINVTALLLAVGNSIVDELSIVGLLGGSEDQGGIGGGILGLVLGNGCLSSVSALKWKDCESVLTSKVTCCGSSG